MKAFNNNYVGYKMFKKDVNDFMDDFFEIYFGNPSEIYGRWQQDYDGMVLWYINRGLPDNIIRYVEAATDCWFACKYCELPSYEF